jgi:hypothetical protein
MNCWVVFNPKAEDMGFISVQSSGVFFAWVVLRGAIPFSSMEDPMFFFVVSTARAVPNYFSGSLSAQRYLV